MESGTRMATRVSRIGDHPAPAVEPSARRLVRPSWDRAHLTWNSLKATHRLSAVPNKGPMRQRSEHPCLVFMRKGGSGSILVKASEHGVPRCQGPTHVAWHLQAVARISGSLVGAVSPGEREGSFSLLRAGTFLQSAGPTHHCLVLAGALLADTHVSD